VQFCTSHVQFCISAVCRCTKFNCQIVRTLSLKDFKEPVTILWNHHKYFYTTPCSTDFQFSKFQIFNGQKGQESQCASWCQILWRSVKPLPRYGDFRFFKMAPTNDLDFPNLDFLTVKRDKIVNMCHRLTVPYFMTIGQTIATIWQHFDFSWRWPPPAWISKISNF